MRVVFDGKTKNTSWKSINHAQIVGPVIQDDIFSILLRFWSPVSIYSLERYFPIWYTSFLIDTVTYGMASSSYLATKSLHGWLVVIHQLYRRNARVSQWFSNHGLILRKFMSNNSKIVFDSDCSKHQNNLHTVPINYTRKHYVSTGFLTSRCYCKINHAAIMTRIVDWDHPVSDSIRIQLTTFQQPWLQN